MSTQTTIIQNPWVGGGVVNNEDNEGYESSPGGVVLPGGSTSAKDVRNMSYY